jgi:hypothetical protein
MTTFTVPLEWLIESWFGTQKQDIPTSLIVAGTILKITTFPKGGGGMRTIQRTITATKDIAFEVSVALRCFITKIKGWHQVKFHITDNNLILNVESSAAAVQYSFPSLKPSEDHVIEPHEDDITLLVSTVDWLNLWMSIPRKGTVTLSISKQTKVLTLKHSGARWGGAIFAKGKPKGDATIVVDTVVAKSVMKGNIQDIFTTVTFMQCGVLQWNSPTITVYVAPSII